MKTILNNMKSKFKLQFHKIFIALYQELKSAKYIISAYGIPFGFLILTLILASILIETIMTPIFCHSDSEITSEFSGREVIIESDSESDKKSKDKSEDKQNESKDDTNSSNKDNKTTDINKNVTNLPFRPKSLGKRKATELEQENEHNNEPSEKALGKRRLIDPEPEVKPESSSDTEESNINKIQQEIWESELREAIRNSLNNNANRDTYGESSKNAAQHQEVDAENNTVDADEGNDSDSSTCYSSINGTETPKTYEKKVSLLQRDEYVKEQQRDLYFED